MTSDYSPKTIKNTYGLLHKTLTYFDPEARFNVKLPKHTHKECRKNKYAPSDEDVLELFSHAPRKLQLAIALAAFHSFRRGEIAALKFKDLDGNRLHVHADLVQDKDNKWIYKDYPKTEDSDRYATLPDYLVSFIGDGAPEDYIIGWMPGTISKRFYELKKGLGIDIRFHDLRHYFASVSAILQIPDVYTASFGGWKADGTVMKEVYQNKIVDMEKAYTELSRQNLALSIESYIDGELAGGLYGVSLGKCFFGESMYSEKENGSKLALIMLAQLLEENGYVMIDCQFHTDHLESMGGVRISYEEYSKLLDIGVRGLRE